MKKQYFLPELELIEGSVEDVLTLSVLEGDAPTYDWNEDLV